MTGHLIANVWGVACPKCHAPTDQACRDLRTGLRRSLFGRRTHPERARLLREQKLAGRTVYQQTRFVPGNGLLLNNTIELTSAITQGLNEGWIRMNTITATTSANLRVWNNWAGTTTSTSTVYGHNWEWNNLGMPQFANDLQRTLYGQWQVIHEREVPSPEELQRREDEAQRFREEQSRRELEAQQRYEQAEYERVLAHARGLELLDLILTPEQREQRRTGRIQVTGSDGGLFVVSIEGGVHGNVYEVDAHGCHLGSICIAPQMRVDGRALPKSDGWVGQILLIQTDEQRFRQVGNWSGRMACRHPDVPILASVA